jgi:hypothetical protein
MAGSPTHRALRGYSLLDCDVACAFVSHAIGVTVSVVANQALTLGFFYVVDNGYG